MTEKDKVELMRRFEPFGREIPKDQVMEVIARMEAVETEGDLIRIKDAVMALNEDVAWLESEGAIGIDVVEMRNRVLEWLYALPTVPQKEYTEQQIRDAFNSGYACGMESEWVSCEEEMPIDSQEVIASVYWTDYGDTITAYGHYNARFDKWKLHSVIEGELIKGFEVIAWMPLPEPYKGGEDK